MHTFFSVFTGGRVCSHRWGETGQNPQCHPAAASSSLQVRLKAHCCPLVAWCRNVLFLENDASHQRRTDGLCCDFDLLCSKIMCNQNPFNHSNWLKGKTLGCVMQLSRKKIKYFRINRGHLQYIKYLHLCIFCRTLEFLMRHLSQLATFSSITNMHTKNLAIVWAPNLLRWLSLSTLLCGCMQRTVTSAAVF